MTKQIDGTVQAFLTRLQDTLPAEDVPAVSPLLDAIAHDRVSFEREDWNDLQSLTLELPGHCPGEMLLRAKNADGTLIKHEAMTQIISNGPAYQYFDTIIALKAVAQAIETRTYPISINISSRHAEDANSLPDIHRLLKQHFGDQLSPSQITFEFLEGYQADNVCPEALIAMKNLGYGFAIDDQSHEDHDAARLANLGPYANFVKIDGKTLDKFRSREIDFQDFVERIKTHAPQAILVCEWVECAQEALALATVFHEIRYVQGRSLEGMNFAQQLLKAQETKETGTNRFMAGPYCVRQTMRSPS